MPLDELDLRILRALQEDARISYRSLAKRLNTTTPTIGSRIKRLESLKIVRGYRVDLDPQTLGGSVHLLRLNVSPAGLDRVAEAFSGHEGVEEVMALSGGALLVKVRIRPPAVTMERLHAAIAEQPDIRSYEEWQAWNIRQRAPDVSVTGLDLKCRECQGPIRGEPVRAKVGGWEQMFCCNVCKRTFLERHKALPSGHTGHKGP